MNSLQKPVAPPQIFNKNNYLHPQFPSRKKIDITITTSTSKIMGLEKPPNPLKLLEKLVRPARKSNKIRVLPFFFHSIKKNMDDIPKKRKKNKNVL